MACRAPGQTQSDGDDSSSTRADDSESGSESESESESESGEDGWTGCDIDEEFSWRCTDLAGLDEFELTSPDVDPGGALPASFNCRGPNPEIGWLNVPPGTQAITLIYTDPTGDLEESWSHWAVYNLPPEQDIAQGSSGWPGETPDLLDPATELTNMGDGMESWFGYVGPCRADEGTFVFEAYATAQLLDLREDATFDALRDALDGLTLGTATLEHVNTPE